MNIKRVLTALIGFPIVVCLLAFGNKYIIDIAFAIIGLIAMNEYIKCVSSKANVISWISYLSIACIGLIHIVPKDIMNLFATLGTPIILFILFLHVIVSNMKINFQDITYTLMGIMYIFCFTLFLPLTYGIESEISGKILIWYIIIASWGTDLFAYLVGKSLGIGKTKFSKVSPNKSIEGCIAGTLGTLVLTILFTLFVNNYLSLEISYVTICIISVVLSIIGQIGDFSASAIKRYFNVKDFSSLLPGHGGMIDRIDSVMFIAPFAYLLLTMFL